MDPKQETGGPAMGVIAERDGASAALAIEAAGLCRRFGRVEALSRLSLSVGKGEFFSLLGPSGCGKTTLLRLIAGLDTPDAGTLRIDGRDVAGVPPHKRPVNTVFQSFALFPHLSVRDNIGFGLRMKRVPAAASQARVDRVMAMMEIADVAARRPAQLSGGQKQRVALARAVVNEPEVLLLDEPLGALDLRLRKQLQLELHQLQRRLGITFVYVTHDQEEALVMSDRIAVMNRGGIAQIGAAEDLYERPRTRFVAQFLGACNIIEGTVENTGGGTSTVRTALGALAVVARPGRAGDRVILGIRPEKLELGIDDAGGALNRVEVKVEEVVYSGPETRYVLRAGEIRLRGVILNARVAGRGFLVGETVACRIPPSALLILEEP